MMDAKKIVSVLVQFAPHALLGAMLSTFILVGYFEAIRLMKADNLPAIAIAIAVTIQLIRLASGLASSDFFRKRSIAKAILVLVFSLTLSIFEAMTETEPAVLVLIWSGFFLEIFLGITLAEDKI